ncbi:TolC family protein [Chitinophaga parva]|nr:TolC family protein [Chitinophaga parva]
MHLEEAIQQATSKSLDYNKAHYIVQSAYWNFKSYQAGFLPKLNLSGALPNYYRTITMITLPDGKYEFVGQNVASSQLGINLTQQLGLTGGQISLSSSLQRIDNFGAYSSKAYTSAPFSFSYYQNNLFYNEYKWQRRIQPVTYQEAKHQYQEDIESISCTTVDRYFELLQAVLQLRLDQENLANNDTLLKITKSRYDIGTMQLNDVLQAKLSLLNAQRSYTNSQLTLDDVERRFARYLNMDRNIYIIPTPPDSIAFFKVDIRQALEKAAINRGYNYAFRRRELEAKQTVVRMKAQRSPAINVNANVGLTQTGSAIKYAYTDPLRNQSLSIGLSIPILDWGVNASNIKMAEANLSLELNNIEQERTANEEDIVYEVAQWEKQQEQMILASEARSIAEQRYQLSKDKYALGSITYTEYNNAQQEKDRAEIDYLGNLHVYWSLYYTIRKLTLFDFLHLKNIVAQQ